MRSVKRTGHLSGGDDSPGETAPLQALFLQAYLPNLLFATGQGAVLPVLAIAARHLGASTTTAGIVVATNGIATFVFDLPAGRVIAALGEVRAGLISTALLVVGLLAALFATTALELGLGVSIAACGSALWSLVRLTHLSRVCPPAIRGRALSLLGGVTRAGNVAGPLIFVAVASASDVSRAFLVDLVAVVAGFAVLAFNRDHGDHGARAVGEPRIRHLRPSAGNRLDFAVASTGTFTISLLRAARVLLLPLWGVHIGLAVGKVSLVYAISSLVDLALFYPAGWVSDRFGRKAVVIPSLALMSFGNVLLPFTHSAATYFAAAVLTGVGNGFGAGIIMTLGADRAPEVGRASFLAFWRLLADVGSAAGPLLGSGAIALVSLSAAPPAVAVVGLGAAVTVGAFMRDLSPAGARARARRTVTAHPPLAPDVGGEPTAS